MRMMIIIIHVSFLSLFSRKKRSEERERVNVEEKRYVYCFYS